MDAEPDTSRDGEKRHAFLLSLADALRPLSGEQEIERVAAAMARAALGVARVVYLSTETSEASGRLEAERASALVTTWRAGRTTRVADVHADPRFTDDERAAYAAASTRATLGVPLLKGGQLAALLVVDHDTARTWTDQEAALLEETAARTSAAVERARAEELLRESDRRTRALLVEATAARAQAESANRAKDEFLATLSHELRTPLAAILLWSHALRSGAVPLADVARAVDAIAESAETQSRLIEDLLDLSRLASGKLVLSMSPTDVAAVVRQGADMFMPLMTTKSLRFDVEIDASLGTAALDGSRLKQILGNLLANAMKFTPDGGAVRLRAHRREAMLEVEVVDTGEGFSPEHQPHLFDRFWQADMGETRQHMGLGIGLALAKHLVTLHGGTLEGHSEGLGRGATFRVRLPWVDADGGLVSERSSPVPAASYRPLQDVLVLLVEDDAHTREAMRWTLVRAGATVFAVPTCVEAMNVIQTHPEIQVVVSDLGLPVMSGFELIERIAAMRRARGLPVPPSCAVSAHARDVDRQRALASGFDMYLSKPVTAERLIEAVADLRDVVRAEARA